jgi:hypothetical protein
MEQQQVVVGDHRFADARHMVSRLSSDITETVNIQVFDDQVPPPALFFVERLEDVTAVRSAGRAQQADIAHLR